MSTDLGQKGESVAVKFLEKQGLKIVIRNWRNRWCEIDVIAVDRAGAVHFVEVKYRHNTSHGSAFDYITPDKARRLQRAASVWMATEAPDRAFQIDVISVEGELDQPKIDYLPNAVIG